MSAVRYNCGNRWQVALVKEGRTLMHAVIIDDIGVRVLSENRKAMRHCTVLTRHGSPYPLPRLARGLLAIGARLGISDAARAICNEALEVTL